MIPILELEIERKLFTKADYVFLDDLIQDIYLLNQITQIQNLKIEFDNKGSETLKILIYTCF